MIKKGCELKIIRKDLIEYKYLNMKININLRGRG